MSDQRAAQRYWLRCPPKYLKVIIRLDDVTWSRLVVIHEPVLTGGTNHRIINAYLIKSAFQRLISINLNKQTLERGTGTIWQVFHPLDRVAAHCLQEIWDWRPDVTREHAPVLGLLPCPSLLPLSLFNLVGRRANVSSPFGGLGAMFYPLSLWSLKLVPSQASTGGD